MLDRLRNLHILDRLSSFWGLINFQRKRGWKEVVFATIEYGIIIALNTIVMLQLDTALGREQSTYIVSKNMIDTLLTYTTGFITSFTPAAIGRVVGYGNKKLSGIVMSAEVICAFLYGLFICATFIPIRVPVLKLLGMSEDEIERSKWYYIIEFLSVPFTIPYAVVSTALVAVWWFGASFFFSSLSALTTFLTFLIAIVGLKGGYTASTLITIIPIVLVGPPMFFYLFKSAAHKFHFTFSLHPWKKNEPSSASTSDTAPSDSAEADGVPLLPADDEEDDDEGEEVSAPPSVSAPPYSTLFNSAHPNVRSFSATLRSVLLPLGFSALMMLGVSALTNTQRLMTGAFNNHAPSSITITDATGRHTMSSNTPGLQATAGYVVSDFTTIPMMVAGFVNSILIAISAPLIAKQLEVRRRRKKNAPSSFGTFGDASRTDGAINPTESAHATASAEDSSSAQTSVQAELKWLRWLYFIVLSLCVLIASVFVVVYSCIGLENIIISMVQTEDIEITSAFVSRLHPLANVEILLVAFCNVIKSAAIASCSFGFCCLAELAGFLVYLPVSIIGHSSQFGTDLPICFWTSLAHQLYLFVTLVFYSYKAYRILFPPRADVKKAALHN